MHTNEPIELFSQRESELTFVMSNFNTYIK